MVFCDTSLPTSRSAGFPNTNTIPYPDTTSLHLLVCHRGQYKLRLSNNIISGYCPLDKSIIITDIKNYSKSVFFSFLVFLFVFSLMPLSSMTNLEWNLLLFYLLFLWVDSILFVYALIFLSTIYTFTLTNYPSNSISWFKFLFSFFSNLFYIRNLKYKLPCQYFFLIFKKYLFILFIIFDCVGSLLLCTGFV